MKRLHRTSQLLGVLFAAVPFAFAAIRAIRTTGDDVRYVWVALASLLGASVVMVVQHDDAARRNRIPLLAAGVFLLSTLTAVLAAWLLGTRVGPGSVLVGSAFGCCYAASAASWMLARS